jgi:protein Tex
MRLLNPCESRIAVRFSVSNQNRLADKWLMDTVRWAWRVKIFLHLDTELMGKCCVKKQKAKQYAYSHVI